MQCVPTQPPLWEFTVPPWKTGKRHNHLQSKQRLPPFQTSAQSYTSYANVCVSKNMDGYMSNWWLLCRRSQQPRGLTLHTVHVIVWSTPPHTHTDTLVYICMRKPMVVLSKPIRHTLSNLEDSALDRGWGGRGGQGGRGGPYLRTSALGQW